jgi:hypothetical protein
MKSQASEVLTERSLKGSKTFMMRSSSSRKLQDHVEKLKEKLKGSTLLSSRGVRDGSL